MFTRSSRHYRGITTSFYSICIVLGTVCVNPLSAVPKFTVSGHVGSTAVLPCELEREVTGTPYIIWGIGNEIVFERHGEETYQGEEYEGRVDVPEEELRKGNCSLVLRNLIPTDAALYWSAKIHKRERVEISLVHLSVEEKQNEERKAVKEVPRAGVWTGVGVGVAGTIAVIAVIVLYQRKRRRNQNRRNPDPPQTYSLPNTQINPANTSQGENPNDQGEHLLLNTSPDDHDLLIPETDVTTNQVLLTPESADTDNQVLLTPESADTDNQVLLTPESADTDNQVLLTPESADTDNQVLLTPESADTDNQVLLTPESADTDNQVLLTPQSADTVKQVQPAKSMENNS